MTRTRDMKVKDVPSRDRKGAVRAWGASGSSHAVSSARFTATLIDSEATAPAEVERTAADAVRAMPDIFRVYTRDQLMYGLAPQDRVSERVLRGYYPVRAGDIIIIPDAYWIYEARGASHGTAFNYDTHVPIIFMGSNIMPGGMMRRWR